MSDPLAAFADPVREWFTSTFREATAPQRKGWPAIANGDHTLILCSDRHRQDPVGVLVGIEPAGGRGRAGGPKARTRVLYLSPLRALAVDVEKNLRAPLQGIGFAAERLGTDVHTPTVGVRTGDTSAADRRQLVRHPPDILITTPESLFWMLTSQARETLANVEAVIIDEIHAMAGTKRGAHLMFSLERLEELAEQSPQRIALSATQRPLDEIARFLGGNEVGVDGTVSPRPVTVVDAGARKELQIEVVVPIEDMANLGQRIEPRPRCISGGLAQRPPFDLAVDASTAPRADRGAPLDTCVLQRPPLVGAAATRLNELAIEKASGEFDGSVAPPPALGAGDEQIGRGAAEGEELVKAHHGSLSRERRLQIEDELKRGDLKGLVATSSLELGIDMGAVDLVVQVASPGSVASGMQRIGRAGHQVGQPSVGKIFPKHRADLLEAAVVVDRMHQGLIEETYFPRNPLDVLAQQLVAMCAMDDWELADLTHLIRRCANFGDLSDEVLGNVLDLLSGTYPSEEFSSCGRGSCGIAPPVSFVGGRDRSGLRSPMQARFPIGVCSGCSSRTALGSVSSTRMVYESRVGETFLLGARPGGSRTSPTNGWLSRRHQAFPARCRSGTATGPVDRSSSGGRSVRSCVKFVNSTKRQRSSASSSATVSTISPPRTCSPTSPTRPRPPVSCSTIARSSSNASATRSAIGGCALHAVRCAGPCPVGYGVAGPAR